MNHQQLGTPPRSAVSISGPYIHFSLPKTKSMCNCDRWWRGASITILEPKPFPHTCLPTPSHVNATSASLCPHLTPPSCPINLEPVSHILDTQKSDIVRLSDFFSFSAKHHFFTKKKNLHFFLEIPRFLQPTIFISISNVKKRKEKKK